MRRLAAFLLLASFALAQGPVTQPTRARRQKGPRAIAVVQWQADEKGNATPALLPVAILDDGKVFDAAIYKPSPSPMSLESGTVYEGFRKGKALGFFTVGAASRSDKGDRPWVGLGRWKTDLPTDTQREVQQANVIIGTPKASSSELPNVPEGETRRKTTQVYDETGKPTEDKDEPPVMIDNRRRAPIERSPRVSAPEKKPAPPVQASPEDDPDRPRLRKGPAAPAQAQTAAAPRPAPKQPEDPDRPALRRGRPQRDVKDTSPTAQPVPREVISRAAVNRPRTYEISAISDADISFLPQDYEFNATVPERQNFLRKMQAYVEQQIAPKAAKPRPSATFKSTAPRSFGFDDIRYEVLDVDFNNTPELVMTGTYILSATQRVPFVFVARADYQGNPRELMFEKNDRFEFIDAVDLDGDGPAELLFRRVAAEGSSFILYRVSSDGLTEVFRGGSAD